VGLTSQVHDFNPGIHDDTGRFWTAPIDRGAGRVNRLLLPLTGLDLLPVTVDRARGDLRADAVGIATAYPARQYAVPVTIQAAEKASVIMSRRSSAIIA
jgi:hypothetical protein